MTMRDHKWKLIFSSLLILLPIIIGLILWPSLPDQMATHWGINNQPDGWSSKGLAVFGMPLMLLALHWLCLVITLRDAQNKGQSRKALTLVFWLIPVLSIFFAAFIYATACGLTPNAGMVMPLVLGAMLMIIGNYLPKCRQNRTLGIKIKWTLENEDNWNATHRLAGRLWFIGGLVILLCIFLPEQIIAPVLMPIMLALVIIPLIYSYLYAKKQK